MNYDGVRTSMRFALILALSTSLYGQYKMETSGAPPADLPAPIAGMLSKQGVKITNNGQPYMEFWFRSTPPPAASLKEENSTWTGVAHGSLIGVVSIPAQLRDRRDQVIKPGLYTLRLSFYPVNGDHQGVAPQRDFLLMSKVADDKDPTSTPKFDDL